MKQPPPSTGLKVTYKPGPVSPRAMSCVCPYVCAYRYVYVSSAVSFRAILPIQFKPFVSQLFLVS